MSAPQSGATGAGGGAATGAAAGTAISPGWGTLIGAVVGAIGGYVEGNEAEDAAKWNATNANNQAESEADAARRQGEIDVGGVVSKEAGSGVDPNTGTAASLERQAAGTAALREQTALYNGRLKAMGLIYEGQQAATSDYVKGGTTLLSGAGKFGQDEGWFS